MSKGKEQIVMLAGIMVEKGISDVVVSPGSRNAPAIILFARQESLNLISIADERSAGFYALGIAIQKRKPVALLCTSGTAVLNYAPAIAEAYYQKVPLLIITADRPSEWIDQGDGQTIRQENIFANYVRKSFQLPALYETQDNIWLAGRMINEAIDCCVFPAAGPVHLNMPVSEPLYQFDFENQVPEPRIIKMADVEKRLPSGLQNQISGQWNNSIAKLILIGQIPFNKTLTEHLVEIAKDSSVVVLTETTSNLYDPAFINCIDRVIDGMNEQTLQLLKPEILVTFEGAVVSKKIKALLRKMKPAAHWHICDDPDDFYTDTYQSLTLTIPVKAETFTAHLSDSAIAVNSDYSNNWHALDHTRRQKHETYLKALEFCDMQVNDLVYKYIPEGTDIHLANSTPVRYAQLFNHNRNHHFYSNRGTSGIDGCISTAAGFASSSGKPVTVITGDIAFFYDSNALWNQKLKPDFRIILINNGGGNIFRILDGPSEFEQLEPFIEATHPYKAEGLATNFGLDYYKATDKKTLEELLTRFYNYNTGCPALLEIITPNILSAEVLKNYFKFLNA